MNVVKQIAGWSIVGMSVMMLIPVGTHTVTKTVFGHDFSQDFDISLWTAMTKGGGFEMLFWVIVGSLALVAFFKWAGAKIKLIPTLLTAGWIISGSVALFASVIVWAVPQEDLMGIDTVIEPALWTALGFFVAREMLGLVDKIRSK